MTDYGRAQAEVLVRSQYTPSSGDPGKVKDFLFGAFPLPEGTVAQADARMLVIPQPGNVRTILMQSDMALGADTQWWSAMASLGVVSEGALPARVFAIDPLAEADDAPLRPVSRQHWLGVQPVRGVEVRAGRMNLPFGLRTDQHLMFTRAATRTDTNADQQHGLAVAGSGKGWRAEVMGFAGNLQVSPAAFREQGYAGTFGYAPFSRLEVGVSSLLGTSASDIDTLQPRLRQAYGTWGRWSPIERLGLYAETDLLFDRAGPDADPATGFVTDVHFDWEFVSGVHLMGGGEFCDRQLSEDGAQSRGWGTIQWYLASHVDLRIDTLMGPLTCTDGAEGRPVGLAQLHFFL